MCGEAVGQTGRNGRYLFVFVHECDCLFCGCYLLRLRWTSTLLDLLKVDLLCGTMSADSSSFIGGHPENNS